VPLSVLFADVRGYTELTEGLEPEQVPALMNRFYETASRALLRHESLLGQVEGDNVMGLFVPGLAGKDYRRKAVDAARSLIHEVDWLELGIGISSGEQFVGNVGGGGYKDFTALGDVTNTAARLTRIAGAGQILVDAATYEATDDRYLTAERRRLELKGKAEPVDAFLIPLD
jgi:adenylate cyclase